MKEILLLQLLLVFSNFVLAQSNVAVNDKSIQDSIFVNKGSAIYRKLDECKLPFFETKKYGLGFVKSNATGDKYSTGAEFDVYNPSKKTIKYIWLTIAGENPVGDLVKTNEGFYKTLKAVGPVRPHDVVTISFDYIWPTDIVEKLRISTIKIQYMDGTIKSTKYNSNMYIGEKAYLDLISAIKEKNDFEAEKEVQNISPNDSNIYSEVD